MVAPGELEGYLKKKSPKTQGKKMVDVWQRRYFVLGGGELKYYKTEKQASTSDSEALKSIAMSSVHSASANPRHADMLVIDFGGERKVKLQAADERERNAWVAALEQAKLKAWSDQEQMAFDEVAEVARSTKSLASEREGVAEVAHVNVEVVEDKRPNGDSKKPPPRAEPRKAAPRKAASAKTQLVAADSTKQSCCTIM